MLPKSTNWTILLSTRPITARTSIASSVSFSVGLNTENNRDARRRGVEATKASFLSLGSYRLP